MRNRRTSAENSGSTWGWVLPWAEGYQPDQITCHRPPQASLSNPSMASSPLRAG